MARRDPKMLQAIVQRIRARAEKYGAPTADDVRADRDERDAHDAG